MHDGAPAHKAKVVQKFLADNNIEVLDWPGNTLDLNPIENAWNELKKEVEQSRPTSITSLKDKLLNIWVTKNAKYFEKLAISMPKRLELVIKEKGDMTNY